MSSEDMNEISAWNESHFTGRGFHFISYENRQFDFEFDVFLDRGAYKLSYWNQRVKFILISSIHARSVTELDFGAMVWYYSMKSGCYVTHLFEGGFYIFTPK